MIDKYPNWRPWVISHEEVIKGFNKAIRKPFGLRDHWISVIPASKWRLDWLDKKIDNLLTWNKTLIDRILRFFK